MHSSRKSVLSKKKKKNTSSSSNIRDEPQRDNNVYFDEELEPVEVEMIPDDQLELTQAELDEEFTKTLSSLDPNKPTKITNFNFKSGQFISKPNNNHIAIHFNHDGIIWSKKEKQELEKLQKEKQQQEIQPNNDDNNGDNNDDDNNEEEEQQQEPQKDDKEKDENENQNEDEKDEEEETILSPESKKRELLVKNQFNFSDRASQTFNEPLRDREIQTEPAPKSVFSQNATPSAIRDEYLNNLLKLKQQQLEEENKKKSKSGFGGGGGGGTGSSSNDNEDSNNNKNNNNNNASSSKRIKHNDEGDALLHSKAMLKALKIMERVTVLNANSDSYFDFRYYRDIDYKRGSFLKQLWKFKYNDGNGNNGKNNNDDNNNNNNDIKMDDNCGEDNNNNNNNKNECGYHMVTCLEWNKCHLDLFAVGYGSYNFNFQTNGMICIYSLKSTVYPEKIILCESGVMSMSFHPKYSSLLCVGYYDGSVAVYDIRNRDDSPIYSSENPQSHHSDPVWDIKWYFDQLQHMKLMFYSISSDSEIKFWKMSQNELTHQVIIKLTTPPISITQTMEPINDEQKELIDINDDDDDDDDDNNNNNEKALCSCFDFNPFMEHLYLVGTEDGHIMECNKTYNDGYTKIYINAHYMNIYCIKWNPFHDKIFLSCSEDWTIKLWETTTTTTNTNTNTKENNNCVVNNNYEPIITYDLGNSINDISWSPYSSTIFAAVTSDGKVHIFDLSQNKNSPLCSEQITTKKSQIKLTKVSFPIGFPLIIVGDEKGNIYALKLSPNLYLDKIKHKDILKNVEPDMFNNNIEFKNKEKEKLINVLNVTGNKVFDIIQHFSPKPIKKKQKKNQIQNV